jgi:hypothetical protein
MRCIGLLPWTSSAVPKKPQAQGGGASEKLLTDFGPPATTVIDH